MQFKAQCRLALGVVAEASFFLVATASSAQTLFDGHWSVEIVAKAGACSMAYAVPIQVEDGNISYVGAFDAVADGSVGNDGELHVRLAHRGNVVQATGALGDDAGFGQWSSTISKCEGTWTAHRG